MKTISTIRTLLRGALLAACIPALALSALAATAGGTSANTGTHPPAASVAQAGPAHSSQTMPAALRPVFYQALAKDAGRAYNINTDGCAVLPKQTLKGCFDSSGAHFTLPAAKAGSSALARSSDVPLFLHLVAFGRGGKFATVTPVEPEIADNQASYRYSNLTEWWRVLPLGFEQGFTIAKRPSGNGELTLALATSRQDAGAPSIRHSRAEPAPAKAWGGNPAETSPSIPLRSEGGDGAVAHFLRAEGGKEIAWGKLRYGQLVVTDAKGKVVPATLTNRGNLVLIAVNDAHAAYPLSVDPLVWLEQKVTASDGAAGDWFGYSVALAGTTALVGAAYATVNGNGGQGAVYVFTESSGTWAQTAKLTASDGAANDNFGFSVALAGTTALVGAFGRNGFQGAAYVFSDSGGSWTQTAELVASDAGAVDAFGGSVALSGTTALIGAPQHNDHQGAAYVFSDSGGIWTQTAELTASDGATDDQFGFSVALDGTTALVGAAHNFGTGQGAAYIFDDVDGTWTQMQKLTASDGGDLDNFGISVALDGTTALVGAFGASGSGNSAQGAAYFFDESDGTWTQTTELTATDGAAIDEFGFSVALAGSTALVGAVGVNSTQGAAYFDVGPPADLDLLTTAPRSVSLGDAYLVQAIATNEASTTSPALAVTVTVPAAASFVSASAVPGSCAESAGLVTCNVGALGAGNAAIASINLKAVSTPGATIENTASIAHGVPKLSDAAPTTYLAICSPGYTRYGGMLAPNARYRTPPYQSAAGNQTVVFNAPPDFVLHVGYRKDAQSQWKIKAFSRHAIYQFGPAGTYEWQINAGSGGGGYVLCILHP